MSSRLAIALLGAACGAVAGCRTPEIAAGVRTEPGGDAAATGGLRAPLSRDGEPIGDVTGHLSVEVSADRTFARLTARGPGVSVNLDRVRGASGHAGAHGPPLMVRLAGDPGAVRFDLCFDRAAVGLVLEHVLPAAATSAPLTTVEVLHKPFAVDGVELCLSDGDLAAPFLRVVAHWDAPDGTRVHVDGAVRPVDRAPGVDPSSIHLHSDPPRPESDLVALLALGS